MTIFIYFLKVNIGLFAFYSLYYLVFSRNTFFRLNRFYLLSSLIISFLLPFVGFRHNNDALPATLNDAAIQPMKDFFYQSSGIYDLIWLEVVQLIVLTGLLVLLVRFIYSITQIFIMLFKSEPLDFTDTYEGNYYWLIKSKFTVSSFSFFNFLILNKEDSFYNRKFVIEHEQVHIDQRHTIDIIVVELIQIVCWYNPVLVFYKKSLQKLHEYIADNIIHHSDLAEYAQFLFAYNFRSQISHLTTSFMQDSMLKQRIKMLTKARSYEYLVMNYLLIIPVVIMLGYFLNTKNVNREFLGSDAWIEQLE